MKYIDRILNRQPSKELSTKTYILDTNVLLQDPHAFTAFGEHRVVICPIVLSEMDRHKGDPIKGFNVREATRNLLRIAKSGNLIKGVPTQDGGIIQLDNDGDDSGRLHKGLNPNQPDNLILLVAMRYKRNFPEQEVILVTNDGILELIALSHGVLAEEYRSNKVDEKILSRPSIVSIELADEVIDKLHKTHQIEPKEAGITEKAMIDLPHHVCLDIVGKINRKHCMATFDKRSQGVLKHVARIVTQSEIDLKKREKTDIADEKKSIRPRNPGQAYAYALCSDKSISFVTIEGSAGTGKSLMALLAGWQQVFGWSHGSENKVLQSEPAYKKLICIRTNYEIGPGLGFLPGDLDEKFAPWQQPILDNLELIAASDGRGTAFLMNQIRSGFIQIIPVTHLRGRSLHDAYILFDDAQNSVKDLPKTIISRAGFGSKIIFTGDTTQIDIPNLPGSSCGLAHVIEKFSNKPGRAHIRLEKGERSELANWAAELL